MDSTNKKIKLTRKTVAKTTVRKDEDDLESATSTAKKRTYDEYLQDHVNDSPRTIIKVLYKSRECSYIS